MIINVYVILKQIRKYPFSLLLFLTVLISFTGCSGEKEQVKELIRPVRYQVIVSSGTDETRSFSGIANSGTEARLSFRVGGTVIALDVKEGDRVKAGKSIAKLDNSDEKLQYEKTLVALEKSKMNRKTAKANLRRTKELYENNNVSLSEYESAKDKYANASASFFVDKRSAELKSKELGYYTLTSPIDGVISGMEISINENITAGQTILVINTVDDIEVTSGIPETYISRVTTGNSVSVRFPSIANKVFDGKITEVSYTVDKESSTYPVTVDIVHSTSEIRPGMPAEVAFSFHREQSSPSLFLPTHAVGEDSKGNFIFTVTLEKEGFGIVHKTPVQIGKLTDNGFEIKSGAADGERVVTAGIAQLTDGLRVRLIK